MNFRQDSPGWILPNESRTEFFPVLAFQDGSHVAVERSRTEVEFQFIGNPFSDVHAPVSAIDQVHAAVAAGRAIDRQLQRPRGSGVHRMGFGGLHFALLRRLPSAATIRPTRVRDPSRNS